MFNNTFMRLLLLGAPGSGKGTIASRILKDFNFTHVSCGDMLRSHVTNQTSIGKEAITFITQGKLVPDKLINQIMTDELARKMDINILIDGYPRTILQAEAIQKTAQNINYIVELDVPINVIKQRLSERWIHEPSGRIYNLSFNPPKKSGIDDVTGEPLLQRIDDKPETIEKRLLEYKEYEFAVAKYFQKEGIFHTFSGNTTNEIWPQVYENLAKVLKPKQKTNYD